MMNKIKIYQVDAFAERLFTGNPAAVCFLKEWMEDITMQSVASENNLAETAFVVQRDKIFEIRWFTPTIEVDLCGHATLATAYVLFNCLDYKEKEITFFSPRSGELKVSLQDEILYLNFPSDNLTVCDNLPSIKKCIGIQPIETLKGKEDYIVVVDSEQDIINIKPNFIEISKLDSRGLIVTAKGEKADFVSRCFFPQCGIDEDPVTGSAHTSLIPLWSKKLGKKEMLAKQLSKRGGDLICKDHGARCLIGGKAKLYMIGEISIG
jgi:PhzF family phenazine biosynthesis protein